MKANAGIVITGQRVTLVPYEKEHMTASEPLSIEDELEMQKSWRDDDKKCTFIVLANAEGDGRPEASYIDENALDRMAGDVNLFFNDHEDPHACEVEIMIAEEKYRRNGFAEEALRRNLNKWHFCLRYNNRLVIWLLCVISKQRLGYVKYNYVPAFNQVEMELITKDKHVKLVDNVLKSAIIHLPYSI
ncbi:hypothetical protein DD238_004976 [Peronospora effusa]|uniref:Uncharacterized protein n=1 Tax=Peronospora effusa TaxID=542832 RepID=A0A3M6VCX2_9STRA|nr:hypothetical protein DD238_004976 [Peronospora effusa]